MEENYKYWVEKARNYSLAHPSISSVSELLLDSNRLYSFVAQFSINLPGKFDIIGETLNGVKKIEHVEFIFPSNFPYKAPKVYLRDDFSRNFPHINPSKEKVNPCIFYGTLDELIQQPKWFDNILDQVVDWLEKAASDSLIDPKQGWEPMRTDDLDGIIIYDVHDIQNKMQASSDALLSTVKYSIINDKYFYARLVGSNEEIKDKDKTSILFYISRLGEHDSKYIPNYLKTFGDLSRYATSCGIDNFRNSVDKYVSNIRGYKKEYIFISIGIRRPFNLIQSHYDIEILNFAIKLKFNKKNDKLHLKSRLFYLSHHNPSNARLLSSLSGFLDLNKLPITQIGCGSLGSKICLHLARNGNDNFILIDNDNFLPHNNARHALTYYGLFKNKAKLLEDSLSNMGLRVNAYPVDVIEAINKIKEQSIFIDSSANLSTRNLLSKINLNGNVIHTSLYDHGKLALMLIEGKNRNPRIDDLMVGLYTECLQNPGLRNQFLSDQAVYLSTGQGCGSFTTIAPDARISLSSAGMSSKIQHYINNEILEFGELYIGNIDELDMSIKWETIEYSKVLVITGSDTYDWEWEARILGQVIEEMNSSALSAFPNETGGALIGHISMVNKTITISELIPAPPDSIISPTYFELGTEGLRKKVKRIENMTNGLLTYVGTWHSHPYGSGASNIDSSTKTKLLVLRDYEPTVCLIWTKSGIVRV